MREKKIISRHMEMLHTSFGGDISALLSDDDVIEIMVNPDGKLWIENLTNGKFFSGKVLASEQVANMIKLVASYQQMIADVEHPEVACEVPIGGARFQGWLPPVVSAPTLTIRKKAIRIFTLDDYVATKSLDEFQAEILRQAIKDHKNILIAGGTASGKTTFANALINELKDSQERIIVLEDVSELQVASLDQVKLVVAANKTMRDLVKGVMRMRPDRIIIGEVRDAAALELLKAWNTGHPGGICTIHANSPEATLLRLEDLIREVVAHVPERLIQEAIDIIVFMQRDGVGKYKIANINFL